MTPGLMIVKTVGKYYPLTIVNETDYNGILEHISDNKCSVRFIYGKNNLSLEEIFSINSDVGNLLEAFNDSRVLRLVNKKKDLRRINNINYSKIEKELEKIF